MQSSFSFPPSSSAPLGLEWKHDDLISNYVSREVSGVRMHAGTEHMHFYQAPVHEATHVGSSSLLVCASEIDSFLMSPFLIYLSV